MFARLTALVSSAAALPFELGEPQGHGWGSWAHFRGTARADGVPVSVFRISAANKLDPKLVAARNGVKRLRMVGAAWLACRRGRSRSPKQRPPPERSPATQLRPHACAAAPPAHPDFQGHC